MMLRRADRRRWDRSGAETHPTQVRGRISGQIRETPVNLLTFDGHRYLVAPRGVTQWVRNLRSAQETALS